MRWVLEIYDGPTGEIEGCQLGDGPIGYEDLDAGARQWLDEQGFGEDNPDIWVNVVAGGTWAPNNRPIAQREIVVALPGQGQAPGDG